MKIHWKSEFHPVLLTVLRAAVGWHFIYEGVSKLFNPEWSAQPYLAGSTGFLSGFYHWLASIDALIPVIDAFNMYGLTAIGLALFLGVVVRWAAVCGFLLLCLYYFAYPPFGSSLAFQPFGGVYAVNSQLIEALILLVMVPLKSHGYGIGAFWSSTTEDTSDARSAPSSDRREAIKNLMTLPVLGLLGFGAIRNKRKYGVDALSGATIQVGAVDLSELKGELPKGKLGNHMISRLVLGGNLIGGWAHSRDLIYIPSLFRAYNTEKKIFETLQLAEQAGINSINIGFPSNDLLQKYKKLTGSRIKVISQVAPDMEAGDYLVNINRAIDYGVDIIQVQGNHCDWLVRDGKTDKIGLMLDHIRSQGYTAGLGAHSVDALIACEQAGIIPDYYMKTLHHDRYWSAHPMENRVAFEVDGQRHLDHNRFHDNIFCLFPDRSVEFVNRAKVPVMGFKVLAAGAIEPEDGFRWAFENGSDFICVGMFDFQIVKDVNITIDTLQTLQNRKRSWYA